jgi:hypothetical protein
MNATTSSDHFPLYIFERRKKRRLKLLKDKTTGYKKKMRHYIKIILAVTAGFGICSGYVFVKYFLRYQ